MKFSSTLSIVLLPHLPFMVQIIPFFGTTTLTKSLPHTTVFVELMELSSNEECDKSSGTCGRCTSELEMIKRSKDSCRFGSFVENKYGIIALPKSFEESFECG